MAEPREAKLRRLEDFRRNLPHMSASALSAVLREANQMIPDLTCRNAMHEARDLIMNTATAYGTLFSVIMLAAITGDNIEFDVLNVFAFLTLAYTECTQFRRLINECLAHTRCSMDEPWRLIMYADEVTPGNQLAPDNFRKIWVFTSAS